MANTWLAATIVAVTAGVVGFFAVLRGSAFAAHAIPQGAFAGAAGAALLGLNPILGLGVFSLAGALGIGWLGRRGRTDVATALGLVVMLGLGALFLSWSVEYAPEIFSLLFGEVLGVSSDEVLPIALLGALSIGAVLLLYRPLMLSSVVGEMGEARGVSRRRIEICFLAVVALTTSMTVPVVGALLMFSLMIAPAAAARCFTRRPGVAILLSAGIAVVTIWISIAASYESGWPIGFFVGALGAAGYAVGRVYAGWRRRSPASATDPQATP